MADIAREFHVSRPTAGPVGGGFVFRDVVELAMTRRFIDGTGLYTDSIPQTALTDPISPLFNRLSVVYDAARRFVRVHHQKPAIV